MIALLSLVAAALLGRYTSQLRTVIQVQALLYVLACVALIGTAPGHGSTRTTGALLGLLLAPLTIGCVALGRSWRKHSAAAADGAA